jgi:signal peptidase I
MSFEIENPEPKRIRRPRLLPKNALFRDIFWSMVLFLMIYIPINMITARAYVEGPSMQPNFYTNDLIVVNRMVYYFGAPSRGDVIVLRNPVNAADDDLIKRIVGLPGETVEIKNGRVFINGLMLEESYIKDFCQGFCDGTWHLKNDQYFILGDNRNNSMDSHSFGPINRNLIVGEAWVRYWPPQRMGVIEHPSYGILSITPTARK